VLLAGGKSINKREDNIARDRRVNRQLRRQGWTVIRIWQLPSAVYATLRLSTPFPE
jgi:G:T-mismatch repair DNA endonuclease (very short patch repair protein)